MYSASGSRGFGAAGRPDRLEEGILGLEEFPEKFRPYEKEPWHSRGLRGMNKAIDAIGRIENLASRLAYEYTQEQDLAKIEKHSH